MLNSRMFRKIIRTQFCYCAVKTKCSFLQVLNPLDAICNRPREDAVCVSQLKNARHIDQGILQQRPDVKIFLPFRFLFYRPEEVFQPQTYNRFLGKDALIADLICKKEANASRDDCVSFSFDINTAFQVFSGRYA